MGDRHLVLIVIWHVVIALPHQLRVTTPTIHDLNSTDLADNSCK